MSDYTKTTDFAAKDNLTTGDPDKKILGADLETEFDAIATAIASKADTTEVDLKADLAGPSFTGGVTVAGGMTVTGDIGLQSGTDVVPASGRGIDFAAAGGDTLAYYEVGTWTPVLIGLTSGTAGLTIAQGDFVRVGSIVHIAGYIHQTSSIPSGQLAVSGLPFTASSDEGWGGSVHYQENAAFTDVSFTVNPSSDRIYFWRDGLSTVALDASYLSNDTYVKFSGMYRV